MAYIRRCDLSIQYRRYASQIDKAIKEVLKKGVYALGPEMQLFEREFSRYIGCRHGIGVASGTDALVLALKSTGIKPGEEVIISTYAPAPTATAIVLAGGRPVFVDVDRETALLDPREIAQSISPRTRYIIPVHLFGYVADMTAICRIARRYQLCVIEDAAQAHGSIFKGKKAGTFGTLSCFSFYPTKNLGGYGDGGMVLTNSRRLADKIMLLRNYGKKYNPFDSEILGTNSRLDELHAAVLRVKLRYLNRMNQQRARLVELYRGGLNETPLKFLREENYMKPNYHVLALICPHKRDNLAKFLGHCGIQTNIYYPKALHLMPAFKQYCKNRTKLNDSELLSKQILALPLYPELSKENVLFVIKKIKEWLWTNQV